MASTPTSNFEYDKPAAGDRGWGTTMNSNLDSIDSHLAAEHRSDAGNEGKHGPQVTILNDSASGVALTIDQTSTASSSNAVSITNSSTGIALNIIQDGDSPIAELTQNGLEQGLKVGRTDSGAASSTFTLGNFFDDVNTSDGKVVAVQQRSTGASGSALFVNNSGTGSGIELIQNGNGTALEVERTNSGSTTNLISITDTADPVNSNIINVSHSGGNVNAHTILINKSGLGEALRIVTEGNQIGAHIFQNGAAYGLDVDASSGGSGISITKNGTINTGHSINIAHSGNQQALLVTSTGVLSGNATTAQFTNAGSAGSVLRLTSSSNSTGFPYTYEGTGQAFTITKTETNSSIVFNITNSGTGAALNVVANNNSRILDLNRTATTGNSPIIDIDDAATGYSLDITKTATSGLGAITATYAANANGIDISKTGTGIGNVIDINNSGSGDGVYIQQNGAGRALDIAQNGSQLAVFINQTSNSSSFRIDNSGATSGNGVQFNFTNGSNIGNILSLTHSGSGNYIVTDNGAVCSNSGVWVNAPCFREYKEEIIELGPEDFRDTLQKVEQMPIARFYDKRDKASGDQRRYFFSPFQDELVEYFDLNKYGVNGVEVAAIALAAIKALKAEVEELKSRLGE